MATDLTDTLCNAFRRGNRVRITIQVDDIDCIVGILARANEPLIEYFANWAVTEKLAKSQRLNEFDRQASISHSDVLVSSGDVGKGDKANLDDAPDREDSVPEI
jgi:hypothetical protein